MNFSTVRGRAGGADRVSGGLALGSWNALQARALPENVILWVRAFWFLDLLVQEPWPEGGGGLGKRLCIRRKGWV